MQAVPANDARGALPHDGTLLGVDVIGPAGHLPLPVVGVGPFPAVRHLVGLPLFSPFADRPADPLTLDRRFRSVELSEDAGQHPARCR